MTCGDVVKFEAGSVSGIVVDPDEEKNGRMGRIRGAVIRNRKGEEVVKDAALVVGEFSLPSPHFPFIHPSPSPPFQSIFPQLFLVNNRVIYIHPPSLHFHFIFPSSSTSPSPLPFIQFILFPTPRCPASQRGLYLPKPHITSFIFSIYFELYTDNR